MPSGGRLTVQLNTHASALIILHVTWFSCARSCAVVEHDALISPDIMDAIEGYSHYDWLGKWAWMPDDMSLMWRSMTLGLYDSQHRCNEKQKTAFSMKTARFSHQSHKQSHTPVWRCIQLQINTQATAMGVVEKNKQTIVDSRSANNTVQKQVWYPNLSLQGFFVSFLALWPERSYDMWS